MELAQLVLVIMDSVSVNVKDGTGASVNVGKVVDIFDTILTPDGWFSRFVREDAPPGDKQLSHQVPLNDFQETLNIVVTQQSDKVPVCRSRTTCEKDARCCQICNLLEGLLSHPSSKQRL